METNENEAARRYDRSPEPSPEEKRKHDLDAEKVNYRIALNEFAFYKGHSTLHEAPGIEAKKGHTWTDNQGRLWVTEKPISAPARSELNSILEVIRNYEGKHGEKSPEEQALDSITNIRSTNRELSNDRLAYFENQPGVFDNGKSAFERDPEPIPEKDAGIER